MSAEPIFPAPETGLSLTLPPALIETLADQVAARLESSIRMDDQAGGYLDRQGAAEYLACKPKRISELTERNAIRHYADGSRKLYRRADLDAYVAGEG